MGEQVGRAVGAPASVREFSCSILGPNASYCDEVRFFDTAWRITLI